jgi:hypothetical protein
MESSKEMTVRVLKHDGAEYRRWKGRLVQLDGSLLVLEAEFDVDVSHHVLGAIARGTKTVEYYWLDRWYNVFRFIEKDGTTRLWYCNINTPPEFNGDVLTYIDLDIDIVVQPDFSFQVLDLDEFESSVARYAYTEHEKQQAQAALAEVISLIEGRQFPFLLTDSSLSSVVQMA